MTSNGAGRLDSIWIKRVRLGPMDAVSEAKVVTGRGIVGNANQGGRRQVTIISREAWQRATEPFDPRPDPIERRANLLVSGVEFARSRGRVLRVGAARLRVYGETKPCRRMDEAAEGLQSALRPDWNGGAFAEVLADAEIRVGDSVEWED